jgi:hypothetical protein
MTLRGTTFESMIILMQNTSALNDSFASDDNSLAAFADTGEFVHLCGKLTNCTSMACAGQLYINGKAVNTTPLSDNMERCATIRPTRF